MKLDIYSDWVREIKSRVYSQQKIGCIAHPSADDTANHSKQPQTKRVKLTISHIAICAVRHLVSLWNRASSIGCCGVESRHCSCIKTKPLWMAKSAIWTICCSKQLLPDYAQFKYLNEFNWNDDCTAFTANGFGLCALSLYVRISLPSPWEL